MSEKQDKRVIIIGAGPAGLTAAYQLCKANIASVILEKDNVVGGLARTVNYKGYRFDIGGHRFFTKVQAVEEMWREVLGADFLRRKRLSRIYYNGKFFFYPLRASNVLSGLGLWNSIRVLLSYLKAKLLPEKPEDTFEQWVSNRFGKHLYQTFFKTYTEKIWGIPCHEISAEWGAQRIKGLSLWGALKDALSRHPSRDKAEVVKTLIDSFDYPKYGPGMMWETVAQLVRENESTVHLGAAVEKIHWKDNRVFAVEVRHSGKVAGIPSGFKATGTDFRRIELAEIISSMPIRELISKLSPAPPRKVQEAAISLNYRDFLTVALIINQRDIFEDNWIYIHDPAVKVGRIQNFKNWSPDMVPDPAKTSIGLEYFCFEGDGLWTRSNQELIELGIEELQTLGFIRATDVEDGTVVRVPKAYPVYDSTYRQSLKVIRQFLCGIENLQLVGRNGMHKYNNQDHSMLTAMLAVKNILGADYDIWEVNADETYHEEIRRGEIRETDEFAALSSTQPRVPTPK
jgi:protoporphyrinogen oxidase